MSRSGTDTTRGVTLLELVIAIFVLAIGTIAAFRSIDHAQRTIGGEVTRVFALQVALNRAEELRLMGAEDGVALPANVVYGPYTWQVEVSEQATRAGFVEATIVTSAAGQPGSRVVTIVREGGAQ